MLKFFRKYNKILLAVFGTGLMIIFLIEPAMRGLGGGLQPLDLGTVAGQPVTRDDQRRAAVQLNVLGTLAGQRGEEGMPLFIASQLHDPWSWMLTSLAARQLGLSVGSEEIDLVLQALDLTESDVTEAARRSGVSREFVRSAIGEWILTDRYRGLVYGMAPIPVFDRVQRYKDLAPLLAQGRGDMTMLLGEPYLSHRIVERYIDAWHASVKISMILVNHSEYAELVDEPGEEQVRALFDKYKGDRIGQGPPYGFGYLVPDQVKLEYLSLSIDALESATELSDREAFEYFSLHRDQFTEKVVSGAVEAAEEVSEGTAEVTGDSLKAPESSPEDAPSPITRQLTFSEARQDVIQRARRDKATQRADAIIQRARQLLAEQVEALRMVDGYRKLPPDFVAKPFQAVAEQILEEEGVELQVHGGGGAWYLEEQLWSIADLSQASASLPGTTGRSVPFALYAMSVRELGAKRSPYTAQLYLQSHVASLPMASEGGRFLFRVTAVSPFASPEYGTVREAVLADARKLAAYEKLVAEADDWIERVTRYGGLDAAAEKPSHTLLSPQAFASRQITQFGFMPPTVEGIGRNENFVDEVMKQAAGHWVAAQESETGDLASESPGLFAVPVPERMSLAIVRIDDFTPMTRSKYDAMALQLFPYARAVLTDLSGIDPLSEEALEGRLDYQESGLETSGDPGEK